MVFGLEFKSNIGKSIAWFLVLAIITGLLMAFFPLMQENNILSLVESFREGFSDNLKHILGLSLENDFRNISEYLLFIFQYLIIFFAIFALQLGAKSLVKEQSAGTIEYLYSQPISRSQILTGKFCANLLLYILVLGFTLLAAFGFSYIFGQGQFEIREVLITLGYIFGLYTLLGICFLCLGNFYSAISNRVGHIDAGSLLIIIFLLIAWIVAIIIGQTELAAYFPFDSFNPIRVFMEGINIFGVLINVALGVLLLLIAYIVYNSKELKF